MRAERPQRGRPDRHVQQPVPGDLQAGDVIARHRVARGAHPVGRLEVGRRRHRAAPRQLGQGEQARVPAHGGTAHEAVAPHVLPPGHDPAPGVQAGREPREHGRPQRRPAHLVLAGPLHPDRPAGDRPRQQHRIQGHVVRAVLPVDPRALHVLHRHLPGLQSQPGRDRRAQQEDALTVAPHGDRAAVPAGDRAAGRHRRVGQERPGELGGQRPGGRARDIPGRLVHHRLVLRRRRQHEPVQVTGVGQRRGRPPSGRAGDSSGGPPRGPVGLGHHAEERPVPHQRRPAAEVQVSKSGQDGDPRGRPHHPSVDHARQGEIVQEPRTPGHLVRDIQPRGTAPGHGPLPRRPGRHRHLGGGPVEHSWLRQRPVAQPGRTISGTDLPVGHGQCCLADPELGRSGVQQQVTGLRARLPERRAGVLDRPAARRDTLIRADAGGHRGYLHPGQGDLEFFGGDLGQRGPDALAVLHLAGPDRDLPVPAEIQPPGQHRVGRQVGRERGDARWHRRRGGNRASRTGWRRGHRVFSG